MNSPAKISLPLQLTGAQLSADLKSSNPRSVRLVQYTGKTVNGYTQTRDFTFACKSDAETFAAARGFQSFNLYGWNGSNWSSDALAS